MVNPASQPGDEGSPLSLQAVETRTTWWASRQNLVWLSLVLILLLGGLFRFTGVNWDDGTHLHPDERHMWFVEMAISLPKSVGEYLDSSVSPLNPYNHDMSYVYGTFPLFLTKFAGELLDLGGADQIHLLGRVLAATFDLITVLVMFFIGKELYDERVGLLSALLSASLVMNIQQAHFFTVDSFTATFVALVFYFAVRMFRYGGWRNVALMGVSYGLAVACKINVATIGLVMGIACLLRIVNELRESQPAVAPGHPALVDWQARVGGMAVELRVDRESPRANGGGGLVVAPPYERNWLDVGTPVAWQLMVSLLIALVVFRLAQPYTFQGPGFFDLKLSQRWVDDMRWVSRLMSGEADYFPSHQWASRTPIVFSLVNMVLWMVGLPMGIASWAGWGFAWFETLRSRRNWQSHLLILSWTTAFFLYQSTRFVKNSRYLVPFYPFMAVLAAYLLVVLWDRARQSAARWARPAAGALLAVVTIGTVLWAWAFTRIYTRPLTRVAASLWVYDNIPEGSTIGWEEWDDILPWGGVGGRNGYAEGIYNDVKFQPYHEDLPEKLDWYVDWLSKADYIILSSNRLYGSIPRLPMRYPMTTRYYKYLFDGSLGFEVIKTFTSRPNVGPIEFNDDNAEEVFTVYDHPKVTVLKKTAAFDPAKVRSLLGDGIDWQEIARIKPVQAPQWKNGLLLSDADRAAQQAGGTWTDIVNRNSLSNALPVFFWLLLVEILGVVTLPITTVLLTGLADRGYVLAKTLGILLLTWITWVLVNLHVVTFTRGAIAGSLLVLTALSALVFWRNRDRITAFWSANRKLILVNEGLFLGFFVVFLLIRYGNPDLWHPAMGGEKPMDLAYLNAVIRSTTFPPYDPWFAGGYLNYYYFGQVIVATMVKLTGIVPWVAYNLAIPLFAALTAMGAFCAACNLTLREAEGDENGRNRAILWGVVAALFVAILGNLGEIGVWLKALRDLGTITAQSSSSLINNVANVLSGLVRVLRGQAKPAFRPEWWYWNATRIMPNGEIEEFPFFTFLYADLHAHLMAMPFALLALGIAVSTARQALGARWQEWRRVAWPGDSVRSVDWAEIGLLGLMGLVVGALRPLNSWDYPTYLVVIGVALLVREYERHDGIDLSMLGSVAWRGAVVLGLSFALYWPFLAHFGTAYTSMERWKGPRTGLDAYLVIHGLFLWILVPWLGVELFGSSAKQSAARILRLGGRHWDRLPRMLGLYQLLVREGRQYDALGGFTVGAWVLILGCLAKSGEWLFILLLLLSLGTLLLVLRRRMAPTMLLVWLLFGLGLALSLFVDLFVLKGDIGRMNTVFKFYLQIWVFWAIAAAVGLSVLVQSGGVSLWAPGRWRFWSGTLAVLLFLAALYPIFATRAKVGDRFDASIGPTLDGMAYMDTARYYDQAEIELRWDKEAINWLLDNVQGSPVIAEANTEPWLYRWGSRVSIYTGLPTIVGWSWHQRQQRSILPDGWVNGRVDDVRALYQDPNTHVKLEIIDKYDVRYIYVGDLERIYYPGEGLDRFDSMVADGLLRLAYENDHVRIYEVVTS